jgi:hypothetical protein
MARETANTRISGNESRTSSAEPPALKPPANQPGIQPGTQPGNQVRGNLLRPLSLVPHRLTAAERHSRICDLAYRRAEQRGFAPGNEVEDWLEAEREVDAGRY